MRIGDSDRFVLQEHEEKPEDCIPAEPGNEEARSFLAHAPTKGLWMPLGREVKVMQCEYSVPEFALTGINMLFTVLLMQMQSLTEFFTSFGNLFTATGVRC